MELQTVVTGAWNAFAIKITTFLPHADWGDYCFCRWLDHCQIAKNGRRQAPKIGLL